MKYPQVVSMPAAVQDWLDEQLEARGIDAIVYTHYILSLLLQRDSLDLPDDPLVFSTKEVGRRGRKRGRNKEDHWDVWDFEQLKRSAAVECLMSASDQKCGIEKLVDELCIKLKEIQSEGESSYCLDLSAAPVTNSSSSLSSSLQDPLQKYHAAFPPLSSKFADTSSSLAIIPDTGSAWNGKKVLVNSFGKNKHSIKTNNSIAKLKLDSTDENKENNNNSETMKSRGHLKEKSKTKKEVGYGFAWNMADERNEIDESAGLDSRNLFHQQNEVNNPENIEWDSRRLYERQRDELENSQGENVHLITLGTNSSDDKNEKKLLEENADDHNLAQLIAKFDHSIEALWNGEFSSSDDISSDENEQELPVDLNELLSSPNKQDFTVELYNLNNKHSLNSFIHSGTNLTSSIWSEHHSNENSLDHEHKMDCNEQNCDKNNCNSKFGELKMDSNCKRNENLKEDNFKLVLVGENKIPGNKFDDKVPKFDTKNPKFIEKDLKFDSIKIPYEKDPKFDDRFYKNSTLTPNKKSWNSNFNSNCEINDKSSDDRLKFLLAGNSNSNENDCKSDFTMGKCVSNPNTENVSNPNTESFMTLNHNKEKSSFIEVIPKKNSESAVKKNEENYEEMKEVSEKGTEKEEEDLLTSTKTHFRPIRIENEASGGNVGSYADGTMFVIPTSLDEVDFKRSESGGLYLEAEADMKMKYMEYRERENEGEFVPKFRVRQSEKCCQTEELEEEVHTKRSKKTCDEFYFPGDEDLAERCVVEDGGWNSNNAPAWGNDSSKNQSWYDIWRMSPGAVKQACVCEANSQNSQYCQLREELTMEGEQLMSDLSYMQHLYQHEQSPQLYDDTHRPFIDNKPSDQNYYAFVSQEYEVEQVLYEGVGKQTLFQSYRDMLPQLKDDSEISCDKKMAGLSSELETEWKEIERPFNAKVIQKDRKRRHSASSQRTRKNSAECHDLGDSYSLKGISLRPVTL
ncbi:hypothetical protein L9F63_015211 [Diploptera punctata]|uniref:Uncharacterized protein n=1 Tax=Diploptera punctata TaxID=6984 RepID=A0AAD8A6H8_DIPPU|nr:hypothetical protein L9F63_015211 [Diploptera punctata]